MTQNIETVCTYSYWERHYLKQFKKRLLKKIAEEIACTTIVFGTAGGFVLGFFWIMGTILQVFGLT